MATIGEHLAAAVERLRASGSESARLDAELLLAHALGVERTTILAHPEGAVGPEAAARLARPPRAAARPASRSPTSAASRSSTAWPSPSTPAP